MARVNNNFDGLHSNQKWVFTIKRNAQKLDCWKMSKSSKNGCKNETPNFMPNWILFGHYVRKFSFSLTNPKQKNPWRIESNGIIVPKNKLLNCSPQLTIVTNKIWHAIADLWLKVPLKNLSRSLTQKLLKTANLQQQNNPFFLTDSNSGKIFCVSKISA